MPHWLNITLIVVLIILLLFLVLYFLSVLSAYKTVKKGFTCKYVHCNKLNSAIHKNCDYCGREMEQWKKPIYINIFRKRKNCKNKEGFPDLRIVRKYIIIDDVILGIAIIATVVGIILLAIK